MELHLFVIGFSLIAHHISA